jgi:hypothetical protein
MSKMRPAIVIPSWLPPSHNSSSIRMSRLVNTSTSQNEAGRVRDSSESATVTNWKPGWQEWRQPIFGRYSNRVSRIATPLCWLLILTAGPRYIYNLADSEGFIRHSEVTSVVLASDWMVGEYRECKAWMKFNGHLMKLFCPTSVDSYTDGRNEHILQVDLWGRTTRADVQRRMAQWQNGRYVSVEESNAAEPLWMWKCQRTSDGLVCWAEN